LTIYSANFTELGYSLNIYFTDGLSFRSQYSELFGSYKFLFRPFRVIDAQHSKPIIIGLLSLITTSLSGFLYLRFLVYFQSDGEHAK